MRVTKQLTLDSKLMSLTISAEISPSSVRGSEVWDTHQLNLAEQWQIKWLPFFKEAIRMLFFSDSVNMILHLFQSLWPIYTFCVYTLKKASAI